MFFNRFFIQKIEGNFLIYFALIDDSSILRDTYASVITREAVERTKQSLMQLYDRLPVAEVEKKAWMPPQSQAETDCATVIGMGSSALTGEVTLSNFSVSAAVTAARSADSKPLSVDPIALLQCEVPLLRLLITEMYTIK